MYTQVELVSSTDGAVVYWIEDAEKQPRLKVGVGIKLLEVTPYLRVNRVFTSLKNTTDLPVKHRIGTIVEIN